MTVASAEDGKLVWTHPNGNLQLVLRSDAIYAAGPKTTGVRLDYATGKKLGSLPTRRACTRATGCADSIFYRTSGGTVRVLTASNTAEHIAPMRPPCQDGVIVSNGHLYWGPWMCGCQLSLYGNICLGPAPPPPNEAELYGDALRTETDNADLKPLEIEPDDWSCYRGNNARTDLTAVAIPKQVRLRWTANIVSNDLPTAPVVAGGLVFVADRTGVVRALDPEGRSVWEAFTGGAVYYPPAVAHDRIYVGSADGRVYAMEARSGRTLWSFRVAPRARLIPVFGRLISSWPVAGGVVVDGDTVYAAAGIAHYDGTYVVALGALTGKLKASNTTSGTIAKKVNNGISLQGNLRIVDGELRFLGGGVYETARYDLRTLKCLNTPKVQVSSQFRTAFYPNYPGYGKFVSLGYTCPDGSTLCHNASYEGSRFSDLARHKPLPAGKRRPAKEASRWNVPRGGPAPEVAWRDKAHRRFTSFVVSGDVLLATGHTAGNPHEPFLVAIRTDDGSDLWLHKIPADAVKGGTAVDSRGNIFVALEDGQLLCFSPADG
jgi:outer membrane protein assembly factor BamB